MVLCVGHLQRTASPLAVSTPLCCLRMPTSRGQWPAECTPPQSSSSTHTVGTSLLTPNHILVPPSTYPAGLPPIQSSSTGASPHCLSPEGTPTAEVIPSAFATKEQQQQQQQPELKQQQQQQQPAARQKLSWTSSRRLLDFRLQTEQAASAKQAQPDDLCDEARLEQRLQRLGLDMLEADGDGNCQVGQGVRQTYGDALGQGRMDEYIHFTCCCWRVCMMAAAECVFREGMEEGCYSA